MPLPAILAAPVVGSALKYLGFMLAMKGAGALATKVAGPLVADAAGKALAGSTKGTALKYLGKTLSGGGALLGNVANTALGGGMEVAGRALQGGSAVAGALAAAVGQIPGALDTASSAVRNWYGGNAQSMAGKMAAPLGAGVGGGVTALGQAAAAPLLNWSRAIRLQQLYGDVASRYDKDLEYIRDNKITPDETRVLGQLQNARNIMTQSGVPRVD